MASLLKVNFISSETYNSLPYISKVARVPVDHSADLQYLRALFVKYKVPKNICIRLVHKHFDCTEGEIMLTKTLEIPKYGTVSVLRPTEVTSAASGLYGIHYFVDADGLLQAYEYSDSPVPQPQPDIEPFLVEFCRTVVKLGLQHKLGLKIYKDLGDLEKVGWTEYEFPEDRSTIMIPKGLPTPEGDYEPSVETEFHADPKDDDEGCSHSGTTVCVHCKSHQTNRNGTNDSSEPEGLYIGGQKIEPGTPFYSFFNKVVEVW